MKPSFILHPSSFILISASRPPAVSGILRHGRRSPRKARRRWFLPTPGRLLLVLLAAEGVLWLSERFRWFAFNQHKGYTVLIAVASVGGFLLLMFFGSFLPWCFAGGSSSASSSCWC